MIKKLSSLTISGFFSGISYHLNKALNKPQYPSFLIFECTENCNSRCRMCNIWKKKPKGELTKEELSQIFSSRLFSKLRWINLTGGEPFLRKDFVDIIEILNSLPNLEGIAVPTNGFLTQRIVDAVESSLRLLDRRKFLSVTVSIDGFEKTHESIRGVKGSFKKAIATLDRLLELKKRYKNFNVGVQPTISRINLKEIKAFYSWIKKKTAAVGFAVMLQSPGYYDNLDSDIGLSKKDLLKLSRFLRKIAKADVQYAYYYYSLARMFESSRRGFGCMAGYKTLFMDSYGSLSPCPVLSFNKAYSFGSFRKGDIFWFSGSSDNLRKRLKSEKICESCTMLCDYINVVKVEFFEHSFFMLMHPVIAVRLIKKAATENNPYF